MDMRALGSSGLTIAPLVLGGNVFGWTADEAASFAVLDAFLDTGFNAIDTADVYSRWAPGHSGGESETVIGKWMKARGTRDRVVLITKVGQDMGAGGKGLGRAHILAGAEASLKRLQTDRIDLYFSHFPDPATPIEETLEAHRALVDSGKVRAVGGSNYDAARYSVVQPHYNLYERGLYEGAFEDLCVREGLGVIPYFALASGFLTGKYRSEADFGKSPRGGGMKRFLNPRGLAILAALDAVADRHGATPAQVALAWLMARLGVTAPIASATSVDQMRDIAGAAAVKLAPGDIAALDAAGAPA